MDTKNSNANRLNFIGLVAIAVLPTLFTLGCYDRKVAPDLPKNTGKIQKIEAQLYPGKGTETLPDDADSKNEESGSTSDE